MIMMSLKKHMVVVTFFFILVFVSITYIQRQTLEDVGNDTKIHSFINFGLQLENISGDGYLIYQPFKETLTEKPAILPLLQIPEKFVAALEVFSTDYSRLINQTTKNISIHTAKHAYLKLLANTVTASVYEDVDFSVVPRLRVALSEIQPFSAEQRNSGLDWTFLGVTMTGNKRVASVQSLLIDIINNNIAGDVMETGVWRGGMSIFMRGVLRVYGQGHRKSFVCDSFAGLPASKMKEDSRDWDHTTYLEVSDNLVKQNFALLGMKDTNILFVKGFFYNTMKPLAKQHFAQTFALLRLDGDMYESTADVLYHFYDKLSIGGYLIMDDWDGFDSKNACLDFFKVHGISPKIIPVDTTSIYWKKTEDVEIRYDVYEKWKVDSKTGSRRSKNKE